MAKNFLNVANLQNKETQGNLKEISPRKPKKINPKKSIPKHIKIKLLPN